MLGGGGGGGEHFKCSSFVAVGESAYFHSAPSPTALNFIPRLLL